jgi:hypothetical protein
VSRQNIEGHLIGSFFADRRPKGAGKSFFQRFSIVSQGGKKATVGRWGKVQHKQRICSLSNEM